VFTGSVEVTTILPKYYEGQVEQCYQIYSFADLQTITNVLDYMVV